MLEIQRYAINFLLIHEKSMSELNGLINWQIKISN